MAGENETFAPEFILLGFTARADLQVMVFVLFPAIYVVTLLGNLGVSVLIRIDPRLHTPTYFFLSRLSLLDICYSSAIVPRSLRDFLAEKKAISFGRCITQLSSFAAWATTECHVLATTAYDRRVATCSPCSSRARVPEDLPWDAGWCLPGWSAQLPKASSPCASQPASVAPCHGSSVPTNPRPVSSRSPEQDKFISLAYSIAVPTLNPFVYSLRNTDLRNAARKAKSRILSAGSTRGSRSAERRGQPRCAEGC